MSEPPLPPNQNPYQAPLEYATRAAPSGSPFASEYEHLRRVAIYQKGVLIAVAVYLAQIAFNVTVRMNGLQPPLIVILPVAVATLVAAIGGIVAVGLLASRLHGVGIGIVLAVLMFIPCVNLIVIFVVNQQANSALMAAGVRVGLFGARMSDLQPIDATEVR